MNSCEVCTEKFNKSTRLAVVCNKCEFSACRVCYEKYIMGDLDEISCMSCKSEWDMDDFIDKFSLKFINNYYKKHKTDILFEKEKQLLPATQPFVEEILRKREYDKKMKEYEMELSAITLKMHQLTTEYKSNMNKTKTDQKFTVRKCVKEFCRGYLSSDWVCGLCETQCCSKCQFEMEDDHVCKQENIETAKVINENGKSCPNCAIIIFKSEGCDQIYCTRCKTAFSWEKGTIENGTIHNPHYFEEMRKEGNLERNLLEVRCGREIDRNFFQALQKYVGFYFNEHAENIILGICQGLIVMRWRELPKYANLRTDNIDLRIEYLMSLITEEHFKSTLLKRDKENRKRKDLGRILNMYINCCTEIFYRLIDYLQKREALKFGDAQKTTILSDYVNFEPITEMQELIYYTNTCLKSIGIGYKCKPYIIDEEGYLARSC